MDTVGELNALLTGPARSIVIAEKDVDLKGLRGTNLLFVLSMAEGSLAAGGRGAGFGERRVVRATLFRYVDGVCEKLYESPDEASAGEFEVPYYVSRLPLTLSDGTESMGYGVVDPELVSQMAKKAVAGFSP